MLNATLILFQMGKLSKSESFEASSLLFLCPFELLNLWQISFYWALTFMDLGMNDLFNYFVVGQQYLPSLFFSCKKAKKKQNRNSNLFELKKSDIIKPFLRKLWCHKGMLSTLCPRLSFYLTECTSSATFIPGPSTTHTKQYYVSKLQILRFSLA